MSKDNNINPLVLIAVIECTRAIKLLKDCHYDTTSLEIKLNALKDELKKTNIN